MTRSTILDAAAALLLVLTVPAVILLVRAQRTGNRAAVGIHSLRVLLAVVAVAILLWWRA